MLHTMRPYRFNRLILQYLSEGAGGQSAASRLALYPAAMGVHKPPFCCLSPWRMGTEFVTKCKTGVFQYVVVRFISTILSTFLFSLGLYEEGKFSLSQPFVWMTAINFVSQSWALYSLFLFFLCAHKELHGMRPFSKFLCMKLIIFFSWWQALCIGILVRVGRINQGYGHSAQEIAVFMRCTVISAEMIVAAVAFTYAFPVSEFPMGAAAKALFRKQSRLSRVHGKGMMKLLAGYHAASTTSPTISSTAASTTASSAVSSKVSSTATPSTTAPAVAMLMSIAEHSCKEEDESNRTEINSKPFAARIITQASRILHFWGSSEYSEKCSSLRPPHIHKGKEEESVVLPSIRSEIPLDVPVPLSSIAVQTDDSQDSLHALFSSDKQCLSLIDSPMDMVSSGNNNNSEVIPPLSMCPPHSPSDSHTHLLPMYQPVVISNAKARKSRYAYGNIDWTHSVDGDYEENSPRSPRINYTPITPITGIISQLPPSPSAALRRPSTLSNALRTLNRADAGKVITSQECIQDNGSCGSTSEYSHDESTDALSDTPSYMGMLQPSTMPHTTAQQDRSRAQNKNNRSVTRTRQRSGSKGHRHDSHTVDGAASPWLQALWISTMPVDLHEDLGDLEAQLGEMYTALAPVAQIKRYIKSNNTNC